MLPDLLLRPRRVGASTKNSPHLVDTSEENLSGDEPADTLSARRAGQATLVGPELVEVENALKQRSKVHSTWLLNTHFCVADHGRQLLEEGRVVVTGIETNGHDGLFVASGVDVDEMELGFAAITTNGMISWGVNVPALEVDGLVVVGEAWVRCPINLSLYYGLLVSDSECGSVAPVVEVTGDAAVVLELGYMV